MSQDGNVDPNLRLGSDGRGKTRYPSPFFDLAQQYTPPTIKELFKWVYFYATNNSFLGPALNKIARYPITDLILEDTNHDLVSRWKMILNNLLQIKTFLMEANTDLITYGNGFVTIHYPFSRFLRCSQCKEQVAWKEAKKRIDNLKIRMKCKKCGADEEAKIVDVHFKSIQHVRLVRINPEFIDIKYNDATGNHVYLYSIPDKLRRQIMSGDPDILEDTPQVYLDAIKQRKKIRLSRQNLFHLKRPTLAGKDMGWGMPLIANALKDLYYFYVLRRGQEAIINEHLTPFDVIFPQANGKFDPYVHSDLSSWKREMESQLAKKRRDPNYKAVVPFPVGFQRIGGDGKAMMLTPELDFLSKTIIGSAGIPQEFVFGGNMQWSGSSISLRTLENDFLHHRSQLIQLVIWIVDRIRIYMGIAAPKSIRMSDFKMADDIQKQQLMLNMAQQKKGSWDELLKEMGKDPETERKKIMDETEWEAKIQEVTMLRAAEAQAKAQRLTMRYQREMQEQAVAQGMNPAQDQAMAGQPDPQEETVQAMAKKMGGQSPEEQAQAIQRLQGVDPNFAARVQTAMAGGAPAQGQPGAQPQADMRPMPTQKPPRRQGGI